MLLKAAPLPIRYQILTDILEDSSSEDFLALQKNLRKHKPRRKLLADQKPDGLWALDGKTSGLTEHQLQLLQLLKQLEVLHELLDMSVTYKQEKVMLGMREVLRTLAEKDLPLRLHHLIQAIHLAIVYNLEGNPIIKSIIREILARQNKDGGWSSMPQEKETCIWSTQYLLWTLGQSENFKGNRKLKQGLTYLQSQLLQKGQSKLLPGMQAWDTLITGSSGLSVISGGTLRYLETLKIVDDSARDRKTNKLLDWLIDAQLKDGLWPSIVDLDRQGDFSVTLRVLKVLKHFQTQRVEETLKYESDYE